jgi:hypothetical protein
MEPEYLDKVHGIMQGVYGDKFTLDVDTFKDKMINETQYRDKIYGIMQGVYGDKFTLDPNTFYTRVLESSKKKSQSEIGSQTTQPGSGSENAQYAFEPGFQGEKPFFQTLRPEDQQIEEEQIVQPNKRVIYRGEGTREALETQFAPEVKKEVRKATIVEATKPIAKEMGEVIKPASKIQKLADLNYMNQNPDDFNATYYDVFKNEAEKSGDPEKYSKDLKDKYANDFIDEEFKEEFNIANELKYIEDKMKKEISSLQSNPNAKTPQGQEYIKNKINEYSQLIQSKTAKLDEVRKANNQKYQQRIDEIDNLFKTGESVMREDALNAEKNELMRKMKLIKLAENPEGLKQEVGEQEYNKIPGSTADEKLNNYLNTRITIYDQFKEDALNAAFDRNRFYGKKKDRADQVYNSYMNLKGELKDLYYLSALKRYANPEDRSNFLQSAGEGFLGEFAGGAFNFDDVGKKHSENLQKIAQESGIQYSDEDKSFIEYTSAPAAPWSNEWWGNMAGTSSAFMAELALTRKPTSAVLKAAGSVIKAAPQMSKIAQGALSRYDKLGKTGQKFVNTVFNAAEEGAYFEGANQMLHDGESSELTFLTGFTGGLLAAPVNALLKKAGGIAFDSFKKGATQEITKDAVTVERAAVLESLGAQKDEVKTLLSEFVKPTAGKDAVYMISGTFGKESPKVIDLLEKVGTHLIARPTGEVAQEFGEELASIYQETSNFEEFKKEFSARFPDADAATQFVVASYMMGVGFGGGNFIGDVFTKKSKQGYDALTPEQKKVADKAIAEADAEIKNKEAEVLNEQEMNTPAKEKSKEETDWDNTRVEIEGKISQSGNQISALENIKQKIYEKYGITDPKTQDISGLSNEDAIKIETINSEIQREKKVKSKEEINLSIHEDNKPVIEEAEESPMAVHADELINKNKQDALQERSNEEVLPREQGETTETGSQPQGMGQGVQGEEVAQQAETEAKRQDEIKKRGLDRLFPVDIDETTPEGKKLAKEKANQEKAIEELDSELSVLEQQKSTPKAKELQLQEEVSVNREPIAEDIAPEQKAKIEEANIKDEDESVSEVYDFNDEIKSVGAKEQFKTFLRSLSPKGVFSRIAWHNSDKEALQPREGQYYANSRRNAEETYKRDFTHPAIIFGNSPQKMDFDQVQEFDINDVKSQGNDIVITDDLSPAIGAEMNYREFIPSSSEQIIPIGTKENIEAFKAFVEQQKAPEVQPTEQVTEQVTEQATPQVTPQVQEEKEPTTEEQTKMEDEAADNYEFSQESRPEVKDAIEFAENPEETIGKVVDEQVTEQQQEEIAKELGISKSKVKERIASEVSKILSGSKDIIENTKSKFNNAVSKVVKYIRKALISLAIVASTGVSFSAIEIISTGYANNAIELAITPLPLNVQETAVRGLAKLGLYDINKNEQLVNNEELEEMPSVSMNPNDIKYKSDNTFTQIVGKVKDNHGRAVKGSELIMIRNQFFNNDGFNYVPGSIKSRSKKGDKYENVIGVAHFMILDDQGVDLTSKTSDSELMAQSSLFKKQRINKDIKPTDFVPVFKKNSDGTVNLKYKKASELTEADITITKLNQYKLSDIDFDSKADGRNFGFNSGTVFGLKTRDGKDVPSLLFTSAGKDAYSRFSGGSAVFIFQDNNGNLIVRDFSGSINMVKKEGLDISSKYNVPIENITIGFYDAGSYTGKPAAKNGIVVYDQYSGYNTLHPNSGGALIVPVSGNKVLEQEKSSDNDASSSIDNNLDKALNEFAQAEQMQGIDKLDKMNELKEKYGEIYEKFSYIDSNFDELVDKFNALRICNFEI